MAKLSDNRLADWLEQVAEGLESGMDAGNALALAKPLPGERSSDLVAAIRDGGGWENVIGEPSLALSFAEHAILSASEKAGSLPKGMRKVAESRRDSAKFKRRLKLSLTYPLFLLHFAALIFSVTYLINGDTMSFLVSFGMVIGPVWLVLGFLWVLAICWPEAFLGLVRHVPIFGSYRMNWESSVLCDVLASCFSAGMGVKDSWEAAVAASANPKHFKLAGQVLQSVQAGGKASEAMGSKVSGLPSGFSEVYRSGELSGKLDINLESAAVRYRSDASSKLLLGALLYPKIILFAIFGYVGYKIIILVSDYFERLSEITM